MGTLAIGRSYGRVTGLFNESILQENRTKRLDFATSSPPCLKKQENSSALMVLGIALRPTPFPLVLRGLAIAPDKS
jgi:hypothetical protein